MKMYFGTRTTMADLPLSREIWGCAAGVAGEISAVYSCVALRMAVGVNGARRRAPYGA
jgi:hypothetical protein